MSGPRLKLALEHDNATRGRHVRDIVQELKRLHWVRGAMIVAADGFVIAADLPPTVAVDSVAALTATLGRELETSATRLGRPSFSTAMFSADDGTMFIAGSRIGYLVVLAEQQANVQAIRGALGDAVALIEAAWAPPGDVRPA
jgi:predicted regulator of Ras-like GTPase activity (Roadblock/LC7/MglB family)